MVIAINVDSVKRVRRPGRGRPSQPGQGHSDVITKSTMIRGPGGIRGAAAAAPGRTTSQPEKFDRGLTGDVGQAVDACWRTCQFFPEKPAADAGQALVKGGPANQTRFAGGGRDRSTRPGKTAVDPWKRSTSSAGEIGIDPALSP